MENRTQVRAKPRRVVCNLQNARAAHIEASQRAGTPVTLTWTTTPAPTNGVTCVATGGSEADGWTGDIALSGKKTVTESAAGTYSY